MTEVNDNRAKLTIAIDYDDTFSADKDAWSSVVRVLQNAGHNVVCVTSRRGTFDSIAELSGELPGGVGVVYCNHNPKRVVTAEKGIHVDIWIDDCPESIPTRQEMERHCA